MDDVEEKGHLVVIPTEQTLSINKTSSLSKETSVLVNSDQAKDSKSKHEDKEGGGYASYAKLWRYVTPLDIVLRMCGALAACGAGSALPLMTIIFGQLVNDFNGWGTGSTSPSELYHAVSTNALWFLYLFIAKFFCVYIHTTCFTITATRATRALRQDFVRSLIRQDISYFDSCTPGSVATSISNNADLVQAGLSEKVGIAIQGLAMLIAAFVVAFTKQWKLTLVVATTLPGAVLAVGITVALDARLEAKILDILSKAGGLVEESLSSIRIVTAFDASRKLQAKYDTYMDVAKRFGVKKGPLLGIQYSAEFFCLYCAYALAIFYGVKLLLKGEIQNGGEVFTVLLSVVIGTSSITMIAPSLGDLTKSAAAAKGILEMIARKPNIDPLGHDGVQPNTITGHISLRNVSFAYPARPSLKVLETGDGADSLDFEAGKITAIVGASGSGKSTIVGLIERWYDPQEGQILLDGQDIRKLNVRWLRSQIGFVQQEPVLFNDTIYNNVVHGLFGTPRDQLPDNEKRKLVQIACIEANADAFIRELPQVYDTPVGERGGFISGGQKQRIAIARSIISDPQVLLLDEATSALDPKAEGIVQDALDSVSKARTTIMIAHRLSTVQKADKIVVMNQGRVIEQGSHNSLIAAGGAYSNLVNAQSLEQSQRDTSTTKQLCEVSDDEPNLEKVLTNQPTTTSTAQPESALEDVSRKLSLARCILIIFKEQRRLWPYFICGFVASIGGGAIFPGQAIVFSRVVLIFQLPQGVLQDRANFWALIFFVLALGVLVCYAFIGMFFTIAAFLASRVYRSKYFGAMLRQDIGFFDIEGHSAGAMTSRLSTDPQRLQDLISSNLGLILIVIVDLIGSCTLAIVVAWQLAVVVLFGALPALFFAGFMRMRLEMQSQDRTSKLYQESARFAAEAVGAIRTVSSLTMEAKVLENYGARLDVTVRKAYRHIIVSMALFGLAESLDLAAMGLAFWYGGKLLSERKYGVETFFVVFVAIIFGGQAAGFLFGYTLNTTKAHSAANHIIDLRRSRPPINTSTGSKPASDQSEIAIEFKDVWFSYSTRPAEVLRGINLKIHHGQKVGIVGASGCGKTTMISLLERFYDITSGALLIHGRKLTSLDVHAYRAMLGLVSQDTTLYQGSIRENVLLGISDEVDEARLIQACKDANMHDFIMSLPEGYDTDAGSRGLALSGGQRQRIAIARALIRDPEILLFDEATSALDTQSEAVVQKALETAAKGRTTVAVAHRLSTIRDSDLIVVLDGGKVVEQGTHEALVAGRGRYYEMVLAQSLDREAK